MIDFSRNDGGREAAGYTGTASDCFVRAVNIACGMGYEHVRESVRDSFSNLDYPRNREGFLNRTAIEDYLDRLGFVVEVPHSDDGTPIGTLADESLRDGRFLVMCCHHWAAVINGVLEDTWDCRLLGGEPRPCYAVWSFPMKSEC